MEMFVAALTIFILALFVGFEVIGKVPPLLHTPLMSGANAISGITLVGTLVTSGMQLTPLAAVLGWIAVVLATINVVGGFLERSDMGAGLGSAGLASGVALFAVGDTGVVVNTPAWAAFINLLYLGAAVLFILALKGMAHPRTAVTGNLLGSAGMLLAIIATLLDRRIVTYELIISGLLVGTLLGVAMSYRAPMTAMPQLVAIFNGFGGGASALAIGAALEEALIRARSSGSYEELNVVFTVSAALGALIGGVALTGSIVAFGKLQGLIEERPVLVPGRHAINIALVVVCLLLSVWLVLEPTWSLSFWLLCVLASVLGVLLVIPIGGADMPVVISLLNAYSGLAAAGHGWVLNNSVLIVSGSLVGAAGFILTALMCKAMNRSLANVAFAGVGTVVRSAQSEEIYANVKSASPEEVAVLLDGARRVVVAPGYGMAVSQAQHAIGELMRTLEKRGVEVEFAIHPVAGRMPGHMNVLLAEADIPYEKLQEMDVINPTFKQTDVVLVIGANDVVNPLARSADPSIPIAGMPILNVDQARTVVVIKRSLSPGFAGIANPLFAADNNLMLFGDAKQAVMDLVAALKTA
jgi:NAD(P) transhydrogenase subunit beta